VTQLVVTNKSASSTSVNIQYHDEPILVVFGDDLMAVSFTHDRQTIDPRLVLTGLATGELQVTFEQELSDPRDFPKIRRVVSQTWRIVPKR
jgi:hypothetical protein